jgi:hypothetical protein
MIKGLLQGCFVACSLLLVVPAGAQEMIHAVSGTVTAIHPKVDMLELATDDGSSGHFQWTNKDKGSYSLDKAIKADSTNPAEIAAPGAHVIIFYFGDGNLRTAVAVETLTQPAIKTITGTVVKLNRHQHTLVIKQASGADVSFNLVPKTVGDTTTGVATDFKFDFDKDQAVNVTAAQTDGTQSALLITPVM